MKSADKTKQQLGAEPEDGRKCVPATDRSETNHKLVDELLKTLCAISPIGMYIAQDGKFQYVNRQFERFIGYSNGELLGTDSLSYILPEDRDMVRESAIAMLKGKRTQPYEYRVFNKAGEIRYIMETVASIQYRGRRAMLGNYMDITERKRMEESIQHLNLTLQAIRNVNQLITREKDRHRLLEGICRSLTETRGYHSAWIALFDDSGGYVTSAEAGLSRGFRPMVERLKRGELPDCAQRALKQSDIMVIENPFSNCTDCPLSSQCPQKGGAMAARLARDGKVYGLLVVSMPTEFVSDKEEHSLFQELAGDISFALHSMEVEDKRQRAEHDLNERVKELNILYHIGNLAQRPRVTLDELFQEVATLLPGGWQYPEITWARISIDDKEFRSKKCGQTVSKQSADITVLGAKVGTVEVGYLEERPAIDEGPFSKEERQLINAIAERLGKITERKQAEEELKNSEERLRILFESAPDAYYLNDLKGNFVDGNRMAEEMTGYERSELIGNSFLKLNLLPAKQIPKAAALLAKNALGQPTGPDEFILKRKDGSRVVAEIRTFPVKIKGEALVLGIARDITERKRAEEALLKAKEQFQVLVEESPLGVSSITRDGHYQYINPKFVEIFGYTLADIPTGREFFARAYPDEEYRKRVISNWLTDLRSSQPGEWRTGTHTVTCKDGSKKTVHMRPVMLASGDQLVTYEDITERKQAEEARCEIDRLKSEFISNISHELRSPLHSIRGFSNLMLEGKVPDPETQKEFLTIIDRQSEHLSSLVDNLLDTSRLEAGQFSIQKRLTPIENIIHSAVETFYTLADEKGILITEDIPPKLPEIEVDGERLKQVMMNLLSNAIKFSKDVGPVSVKVKARDGGLLVQVIDRGIGIPKEVMPRLFERFQQAEAASRIGGAGLGLYISRQIIEAHGGRIWAKSKEGKGSTFNFTLPLGQEGGNSHE